MRYNVKVKFNKDYVKVSGDSIEIGVMSKPQKGKANEEIVRKLARHFGVSSSEVAILSGKASKRKIVEVRR